MAFTKAPVNDTHNTIRVNPTGSPFLTSSGGLVPVTCKTINAFPITEKQWSGEPKRRIHKRSGWVKTALSGSVKTTDTLSASAVLSDSSLSSIVFFGKADTYYSVDTSALSVSTVTTHALSPLGYASFGAGTNLIDSTNARRIAFLANGYLTSWLDPTAGSITSTNLTGISLDSTKGLVFINGYLFAVDSTGTKIYNSTAAGVYTTWNATDYLDAEQYGDPVLWIDKHKNFLVAFGSRSVEFFYDGGVEVGSPLVRQEAYSHQIGLFTTTVSTTDIGGRHVARIGDDLYFLGKKEGDNIGLFRVRNFQVEEIGSQYFSGSYNYSSTGAILANTNYISIETIIQDNNPMVLIQLSADDNLVYFPDEDTFVQFTINTSDGYDIPDTTLRAGSWNWHPLKGVPFVIGQDNLTSATMNIWRPDVTNSISITATIYSDVVDNGINFRKHIARVDAVGDLNNNSLTLAYNGTPDFGQSYTTTYAINSNTIGYGNNVSWYNLGAFRRFSLKLTLTGTYGSIFDGFDVEYNAGSA